EVAALAAPRGDGVGHPVDHLAQRALALGGAQGAPEVLLGDDVGGVHRPRRRELDAELLEGHGAVGEVGDAGVAPLPRELVVGVHAGSGEVTADADAGLLGGDGHGALLGWLDGGRTSVVVQSPGGPGPSWTPWPPTPSTTTCCAFSTVKPNRTTRCG